jgi:hypothetical protein
MIGAGAGVTGATGIVAVPATEGVGIGAGAGVVAGGAVKSVDIGLELLEAATVSSAGVVLAWSLAASLQPTIKMPPMRTVWIPTMTRILT